MVDPILRQPNEAEIHERVMRAIRQFSESEWPGLLVVMRTRCKASAAQSRAEPTRNGGRDLGALDQGQAGQLLDLQTLVAGAVGRPGFGEVRPGWMIFQSEQPIRSGSIRGRVVIGWTK